MSFSRNYASLFVIPAPDQSRGQAPAGIPALSAIPREDLRSIYHWQIRTRGDDKKMDDKKV